MNGNGHVDTVSEWIVMGEVALLLLIVAIITAALFRSWPWRHGLFKNTTCK